MKIRKDDMVVIIAGKHKGKTGKVLRTLQEKERVVVDGLNKVKRHVKKNREKQGQIIEFEAPIHISNVMLVDPKNTKKRTRIGYSKNAKGKKQRIAKKSKTIL